MKYRIKQEGYWFYPQRSGPTTLWSWSNYEDSEYGYDIALSYDSLEKAKSFLEWEARPKPPPPKVTIHPYP